MLTRSSKRIHNPMRYTGTLSSFYSKKFEVDKKYFFSSEKMRNSVNYICDYAHSFFILVLTRCDYAHTISYPCTS